MLPVFYQTHLKSQLILSEYLMLKILINVLQSIKKVSLETLATRCAIAALFARMEHPGEKRSDLDLKSLALGAPTYPYQFYLRVYGRKSRDYCHYLAGLFHSKKLLCIDGTCIALQPTVKRARHIGRV